MAQVEIQGQSISYQIFPRLFDRDVLFLHGPLSSKTTWNPALEKIKLRSPKGEGRALCLDLLGWGESQEGLRAEEQLHPLAQAQLLLQVIPSLGLSEIVLAGHSFGGLVALYMMSEEPDLFSGAFLLSPMGYRSSSLFVEIKKSFLEMKENPERRIQVLKNQFSSLNLKKAEEKNFEKDLHAISPRVWGEWADQVASSDVESRLKSIDLPVRILHGQRDTNLPKEGSKALAKRLPQGEFREIKGAGSALHMEKPEQFAEELLDFIASIPTSFHDSP